jgi:hypothetical protein
MPADDPITALQALNASDDRQGLPVPDIANDFLRGLRLFYPVTAVPAVAVEGALHWVSRRKHANRDELVGVLAEEMKYRGKQIEHLVEASEEHRRFMADEMPGLLLDGLRKAETARAKGRVAHLARILAHTAEAGPRTGADYAEEMMRIALELSERDVATLREIARHDARPAAGETRPVRGSEMQRWYSIDWYKLGFSEHEVESICGKLFGLGLLAPLLSAENRPPYSTSSVPVNAYELLHKGRDLLTYINSQAPTPAR